MDLNPERQEAHQNWVAEQEEHFKGFFGDMDDASLAYQAVCIFSAELEGIPTHNPDRDKIIDGVVKTLLSGEAPVPSLFGAGRTEIAWRSFTNVLISRIASNAEERHG